jgi:hypothetical protein
MISFQSSDQLVYCLIGVHIDSRVYLRAFKERSEYVSGAYIWGVSLFVLSRRIDGERKSLLSELICNM